MKNPLPSTVSPLSRAIAWSSLALASLTPAALPMSPQVITDEVIGLAGGASGVSSLGTIQSDGKGSWVATAGMAGIPGSANAFYGSLSGGS